MSVIVPLEVPFSNTLTPIKGEPLASNTAPVTRTAWDAVTENECPISGAAIASPIEDNATNKLKVIGTDTSFFLRGEKTDEKKSFFP